VFIVITFAATQIGRSVAMIPDYSKAKAAATRIFNLIKSDDPIDDQGIVLVS
jgi:ATP-binding cassette subfamily B (MDR/TAP) protein 1